MQIKKSNGIKRAAVYLRMSSNPQKDSISQQRDACLLYASDHGFKVVDEFADEGISGISSKLKRKGFQRLVTDAESGKFDYVICWSQSRASRSKPRQFVAEMNPLADAGVKLVFTDKGEIDMDDLSGFLRSTIDAHSNNDYVMKMTREVVRGQRDKRAAKGKWVAGTPPLGLSYIKGDINKDPAAGDIVLGDPDDVETVRKMFNWYLEGFSDRSIVEKLRDERGQKRTQRFVQKVLTNPMYAGDYRWNSTSAARFYSLREGRITDDFKTGKTDESDQIYIPDNHPAIIDRETFTKVQHLRAERSKKTTPFRNGGEHLLTGLCRCEKCGSKFSGHRYKGKNGKPDRLTLSCNGYRLGTCKANYVDQRDIVASIVASLDDLLSPERVDQLRNEYYAEVTEQRDTVDVEALKVRLTEMQAGYDSFRNRMMKMPEETLSDFADDLRAQKADIDKLSDQIKDAELAQGGDDGATVKFDSQLSALVNIVDELKVAIAEITDTHPQLVRNLIASMVESIELDVDSEKVSDKHTRYHWKGGEITLKPGFNLIPAN